MSAPRLRPMVSALRAYRSEKLVQNALDRLHGPVSVRERPEGIEVVFTPPGCPAAAIAGIAAVPGRLPALTRLPGEPLLALIARAGHAATGHGPLPVTFIVHEAMP